SGETLEGFGARQLRETPWSRHCKREPQRRYLQAGTTERLRILEDYLAGISVLGHDTDFVIPQSDCRERSERHLLLPVRQTTPASPGPLADTPGQCGERNR